MKITFFDEQEKAKWDALSADEKANWIEYAKDLQLEYPEVFSGENFDFAELRSAAAHGV